MKTTLTTLLPTSSPLRWSLLAGLLIVFGGTGSVRAEAPTPSAAPAAPTAPSLEKHDNKLVLRVGDDDEESSAQRDLRSRLSPDQLLTLELAKTQSHSSKLESFGVPAVFFLTIMLIVGMSLYASFRKDRQRHETLRLMVEKGTQIPVELIQPPARKRNDLRRGLLLVTTGLGLGLFLAICAPHRSWSAGFIPLLIGVGYIAAWKLETKA